MRITPLEIHNHQFARRLSGLDPEEVSSFLQMIADDYEQVLRENERMKDQVSRLETRNEELASGETILRATLVSAQDMAEKLRETAVAESEVLLSTSESRAEKILDAAHRRAARLGEEIRELRGLRTHFAESLRATIDTHIGLIDRLEKDPEAPIPHLSGAVRALVPGLGAELSSDSPSIAESPEPEKPRATFAPPACPAPMGGH